MRSGVNRSRAFVVVKPGAVLSEEDIIESCKKHLPAIKNQKVSNLWPTFPRTPTGKYFVKYSKNLIGRAVNEGCKEGGFNLLEKMKYFSKARVLSFIVSFVRLD